MMGRRLERVKRESKHLTTTDYRSSYTPAKYPLQTFLTFLTQRLENKKQTLILSMKSMFSQQISEVGTDRESVHTRLKCDETGSIGACALWEYHDLKTGHSQRRNTSVLL